MRRKCENSVDNTYFKEKIFDLQFLDYFTATSWPLVFLNLLKSLKVKISKGSKL